TIAGTSRDTNAKDSQNASAKTTGAIQALWLCTSSITGPETAPIPGTLQHEQRDRRRGDAEGSDMAELPNSRCADTPERRSGPHGQGGRGLARPRRALTTAPPPAKLWCEARPDRGSAWSASGEGSVHAKLANPGARCPAGRDRYRSHRRPAEELWAEP